MTPSEVGALLTFLTVIIPRIPYLLKPKEKQNNNKEKQQLPEANKQNV